MDTLLVEMLLYRRHYRQSDSNKKHRGSNKKAIGTRQLPLTIELPSGQLAAIWTAAADMMRSLRRLRRSTLQHRDDSWLDLAREMILWKLQSFSQTQRVDQPTSRFPWRLSRFTPR